MMNKVVRILLILITLFHSLHLSKSSSFDQYHCINETMPFTVSNGDIKFEYAIFPGSLVAVNSCLKSRQPRRLNVERKHLTYIVDLPGMKKSFIIEPHWAEYYISLDNILQSWTDNKGHYGRVSNRRIFVENKDQLRCAFDDKIVSRLDINYDAIERQEQLAVVYQVYWLYYKVSLNSTFRASDIYGGSVTETDLASGGADARSPTKMVTSASYGITFYMVLTTSTMTPQARMIMKEGREKAYQYLPDLDMKIAFIEGGSIGFKSFLLRKKTVHEVIDTMSKPWQPFKLKEAKLIGYTMNDIKADRLPSQIKTQSEFVKKSWNKVLQIRHVGKYMLKLYIEWEDIGWDERGREYVIKKYWDQNDIEKDSISEEIRFGVNARNLMIRAWCYLDGFGRRQWKKFFDKKNLVPYEYKEFLFQGENGHPGVIISY